MAKKVKRTVFIVDNETKVCEMIYETLDSSGVVAVYFTDPVRCLDRISSEGCDLLITDLKISGMDGLELMRQAKLLIPWLPVVIVTDCGDVPTAVKAARAGVADFIKKPFVKDDFIRKVRSLLPATDSIPGRLTKTEAEVLRLVALGKSSSEIAYQLQRSPRTIELHRGRAMQKLGLRGFTDLLKRIGGAGVPEFLAAEDGDQADANTTEDGQ